MVNILYVCRNNIIRSPAAEIITRSIAEKKNLSFPLEVDSAAVYSSHTHYSMLVPMENALSQIGYYASCQTASKPVDGTLMEWADYVLCMEPWHVDALRSRYPGAENKLATISAFDSHPYSSVKDPLDTTRSRLFRLTNPLRGTLLPDEKKFF
jgi:protein arginine phosphatase